MNNPNEINTKKVLMLMREGNVGIKSFFDNLEVGKLKIKFSDFYSMKKGMGVLNRNSYNFERKPSGNILIVSI